MNHLNRSKITALAFFLTLVACGAPESSSSLDGTRWTTDCGSKGVESTQVAFTSSSMTVTSTIFSKAGCSGEELFSSRYTYDYSIGETLGDITAFENVKELDLTFKSWQLFQNTEAAYSILKHASEAFCGLTAGGAPATYAISTWITFLSPETGSTSQTLTPTTANCRFSNWGGAGNGWITLHGFDQDFDGVSQQTSADDSATVRLAEGRKVYTLIKIETRSDKQAGIYFGDRSDIYSDGFSAERRPTSVGNLYLKKR